MESKGLTGMDMELVREIKSIRVQYLGVTETKKKEQRCLTIENDYMQLHCGVADFAWTQAALACLVWVENFGGWKFISERFVTVDILEVNRLVTLIVVYIPNEDANAGDKNIFFELLQKIAIADCRESDDFARH